MESTGLELNPLKPVMAKHVGIIQKIFISLFVIFFLEISKVSLCPDPVHFIIPLRLERTSWAGLVPINDY